MVPLSGEETETIYGVKVEITIALLAPSDPAAPGVGMVDKSVLYPPSTPVIVPPWVKIACPEI